MTMLLPSFNFIRVKEIMKLLCNFNLTKVKQKLFLFLRAGAFKKNKLNKQYVTFTHDRG